VGIDPYGAHTSEARWGPTACGEHGGDRRESGDETVTCGSEDREGKYGAPMITVKIGVNLGKYGATMIAVKIGVNLGGHAKMWADFIELGFLSSLQNKKTQKCQKKFLKFFWGIILKNMRVNFSLIFQQSL
jgi:hypothetical protein